jgi:uncharacterized membrane protein
VTEGSRANNRLGDVLADDITMPMVVYVLYLVGLATGIAAMIGVILAYANRDKTAGTWLESHYTFQIRTFWIGFLILCVAALTFVLGIGVLILLAFWIWAAVRAIIGLSKLSKREPIADPGTWTW